MLTIKNGFSLIELMVTLAVAAILLAVGIPGMQSLMEGSRVRNATNEILSDLLYARSQAVNLGIEITVCPLDSSKTCVSDWNLGMSIFIDENDNQKLDATEATIRVANPMSSIDKLIFNNGSWLSFNPEGVTTKNGTFSYCTNSQDPAGIVLSQSGRARIEHSEASCP